MRATVEEMLSFMELRLIPIAWLNDSVNINLMFRVWKYPGTKVAGGSGDLEI